MDLSPLSVLRGRRVLVTGHTGFKGSWLCSWLRNLGAEVSGLALPPGELSHFRLCRIQEQVSHHEGDLRDPEAIAAAFAAARPQLVFHLAAQALVRPSYADPKGTFDVNVGGLVNLLEQVRASGDVRAVVIVTSDKCYDNREWVHAYRETDPMGGHDPYSASKGCQELVAAAYRRSFFAEGVALATARAGNVVGGGDWCVDRLIPDCVRALSAGEAVVIRNPAAVRPWQHVLDPLLGYLLLAASLLEHGQRDAEGFNFGPQDYDIVDVGQLAKLFVEHWGSGELTLGQVQGPHEANMLRLACDKAARRLGWRSVLDVRDTIGWTAAWYRRWHEGGDAAALQALTAEQIATFSERAAAR